MSNVNHCPECGKGTLKDVNHQQSPIAFSCRHGKATVAALRASGKENRAEANAVGNSSNLGGEDEGESDDLEAIEFPDFIKSVEDASEIGEVHDLVAKVKTNSLAPKEDTRRSRADFIANSIWDCLEYRFTYQSKYDRKNKPITRFTYRCCQNGKRQRKSKKQVGEGVKNRDRERMEVFECEGWLHITVNDNNDHVLVKLKHPEAHDKYVTIDIPDEVKIFIKNNVHLTTTQLWSEIIKMYPTQRFSRKAVYALWHSLSSEKWKRDPDEVKSARQLLDEAAHKPSVLAKNTFTVEHVLLSDEEGFTAIAFVLPELLMRWGGKYVRYKLILPTHLVQTNGSGFEVYTAVGELYDLNFPLGYLMLRSPPASKGETKISGGKERLITQFLNHLKVKSKLRPIVILTDKDWSEINASRKVFPEVKHQLCFWHNLTSIKKRLSILRRRPCFYNVMEAKSEYDFINPDFVPIAQAKDPEKAKKEYVADTFIPQLTIRFKGAVQSSAPARPAGVRYTLKINNVVQAIFRAPEASQTNGSANEEGSDEESADLHEQVNHFIDDAEQDQEDGPDWMFEQGETSSKDPKYVFCPAAHRKQILHIFTKHFCQHPFFLERLQGKPWTAKRIRDEAVWEMYNFCTIRGLREVWGYLWANWYSPSRWKLWARSSLPNLLPKHRTTMGTENFWRQLKHQFLHNVNRPRIDHLVYILIMEVTPSYLARITRLEDSRNGRPKSLTSQQVYFKRTWKALEKRDIQADRYTTNVSAWTCNCGAQKYNAYHLCKHLVQAVQSPIPISFWREAKRRRVQPLYIHEALGNSNSTPADLGSVTDGNDFAQMDSDGEDAAGLPEKGRKRKFSLNSENETDHGQKRPRIETIDLTMSSPEPSNSTKGEDVDFPASNDLFQPEDPGSSSGIEFGLADELEIDELRASFMEKAEAFARASDIFRHASKTADRMWLERHKDLGKRVEKMVEDVEWLEKNGKTRPKTWGTGGGKVEKRRAASTMGYIPRQQ